jgi:hypothetical protein
MDCPWLASSLGDATDAVIRRVIVGGEGEDLRGVRSCFRVELPAVPSQAGSCTSQGGWLARRRRASLVIASVAPRRLSAFQSEPLQWLRYHVSRSDDYSSLVASPRLPKPPWRRCVVSTERLLPGSSDARNPLVWFGTPVHWTLTQLDPTEAGTRSWGYDLAREAWDAYQHRIDELEISGWVRQAPETTQYGQGASQVMGRADTVITLQLARTPSTDI